MTLYAVTREAGPGWAPGGIFDQPAVDEHAAYMSALADDGLLLFAGPIGESEDGHVRVLLIAEADDEAAIHARLGGDPWARSEQLRVVNIGPWTILVGEERIAR